MNNKKGITLISLVVTIVILLMLAAISIAVAVGPNGMMNKARDAKIDSRFASIMDKAQARNASLALAFEANETGEHHKDFIDRLEREGLLYKGTGIGEDEYDSENSKVLKIGRLQNGDFKYTFTVQDGTLVGKDIADLIDSLPEAEGSNEDLKYMTLKIRTTTTNETVDLPISNTENLKINWDSENSLSSFENANKTSDPTYIYSNPGNYVVQIEGECEPGTTFGKNYYNYSNTNLKGIKHWGENGFYAINCLGQNLEGQIAEPSRNSFINVTNFDYAFFRCESLTGGIPENLFATATNVTSFEWTFYLANGITKALPEKLFWNCPNVEDFLETFSHMESLRGPIPEKLFWQCTEVKQFYMTFMWCLELSGKIPERLFEKNINATYFYYTFDGCKNLIGPIPENLFSKNINAEVFVRTFSRSPKLSGSIPEKLFYNNTKVNNFGSVFYGCSALTGSIPENLFINNPNVEYFNSFFNGCSGLTGSIPANLFSSNNNAIDFKNTFTDCSGLTGEAPALWVTHSGAAGTRCFSGCTSLSNYDSIPSSWKI